MRRTLVLLALGALVCLLAGAVYCALEWAWRAYDDHDRGLWEGLAIAVVISFGNDVANRVARKISARKFA